MTVHYGAVGGEEGHDPTHVANQRLDDPETHVGGDLYFWAIVADDTDDGFTVGVGERSYAITGSDVPVAAGDAVQIIGTLQSTDTVAADRVVVSPRSNLDYLYVVSVVGLLLTAAVFSRRWTIDWDSLTVVPRGGFDD